MANVKVTQDKNGVRWLELMRNGSGTLLEIRDKEEALQIISALQQSVHLTGLCVCPEEWSIDIHGNCSNWGLAKSPRK